MTEFYLKILSGNHIGAEIPLEPGRYSLGKDESCDLILTDDSLSSVQLIIDIAENGQVSLQSGDNSTSLLIDNDAVGPSIQYRIFDVVQSGSLLIALGPSDVSWPPLSIPNAATNSAPPAASETPTPSDPSEPEAVEIELSAGDFAEPFIEENSLDGDEDRDDDFDDQSEFNKKWLLAIPAVLVAGVFLLIVATLNTSSEPETQLKSTTESPIALAQKIKGRLGLKDLTFKLLPDQTVFVGGYTQTMQGKSDIQRALREQGISFKSQIAVMNEMRINAEQLLTSLGYKALELELDTTPGSLVLSGYVATSEELDKIVNALKQEVHGLISVVDQVENQVGRVNTLKSMMREKGLIPRIQVVVRGATIILKGHLLDEGQVYDLNTIIEKFQQRYANKPAIQLATKYPGSLSTDNQLPLALNIRGISMGKVPYVVLFDGTKYLTGAKLSNGFIIEDINLDYLLLTNGTDRIKYRLGGNRGGQNKQ